MVDSIPAKEFTTDEVAEVWHTALTGLAVSHHALTLTLLPSRPSDSLGLCPSRFRPPLLQSLSRWLTGRLSDPAPAQQRGRHRASPASLPLAASCRAHADLPAPRFRCPP